MSPCSSGCLQTSPSPTMLHDIGGSMLTTGSWRESASPGDAFPGSALQPAQMMAGGSWKDHGVCSLISQKSRDRRGQVAGSLLPGQHSPVVRSPRPLGFSKDCKARQVPTHPGVHLADQAPGGTGGGSDGAARANCPEPSSLCLPGSCRASHCRVSPPGWRLRLQRGSLHPAPLLNWVSRARGLPPMGEQ